jgi:quinol monooxygenase YgiN
MKALLPEKLKRMVIPFFVMSLMTLLSIHSTYAQQSELVVRLAKLRIDSAQLENYKAALKEEVETSVRVEPGVLSLQAVADKNDPTQITIMEIYANQQAYLSHLETPHFRKYKSTTKDMVKSLELLETVPIVLGTKKKTRGGNQK